MRRVDRSAITDANGRHIPVTRSPIGRREDDDNADDAPEPRTRRFELNRDRHIRAELDRLSGQVRRLAPPHPRSPHTFHEERAEIARALQSLAALMER